MIDVDKLSVIEELGRAAEVLSVEMVEGKIVVDEMYAAVERVSEKLVMELFARILSGTVGLLVKFLAMTVIVVQ